jgi:hypothetical protein
VRVNSCILEGEAVPAPLLTPIVLQLIDVCLMVRVRISIRARCTTLCHKVCQWLAIGRWISPGSPVSSTNKTDRHDIPEILLKVALNTIKQTSNNCNTMGVNSGAGTVSPSRIHEFTLAFFVGSCCSSFGFRCTYCFVDHSLTLRDFSFVHCIVCPLNYGFWLLLLNLQTFLA